jgi:hypothetical protein
MKKASRPSRVPASRNRPEQATANELFEFDEIVSCSGSTDRIEKEIPIENSVAIASVHGGSTLALGAVERSVRPDPCEEAGRHHRQRECAVLSQ